jgi:hypothetical protein
VQHHARRLATHGVLVATLVAGILATRPAAAAEGIYLTWNDCFQGPSHTSNLDFACADNGGSNDLFCAFTMPEAANNVVAIEVVVDVQHSTTALPPWWRLDSGGCRNGNLLASPNPGGRNACVDMWQGTGAIAGVQGYIPMEPRGADSQARIKVAASVLPPEAVSVDGSNMYYAVRITLANLKTVGAGSCPGCSEPSCLVLNSVLVGRIPGSPGGDYFLQTPGPGGANWALWQGGSGANCAAVPVRDRAWGQVKSLYR